MQPLVEEYPVLERGSWEVPAYYELLRRALPGVFSKPKGAPR